MSPNPTTSPDTSNIGEDSPSSSKNSPSKIMCCSEVRQYKRKVDNDDETQDILDQFKDQVGGKAPQRRLESSQQVPWPSYIHIFAVVSNHSRGSKKLKGTSFYAFQNSVRRVPEMVLIPEECMLEVVGTQQAFNMKKSCLVRQPGGLELSCKKHLDTIYTVYMLRWQKLPKLTVDEPPPPPLFPDDDYNIYMNDYPQEPEMGNSNARNYLQASEDEVMANGILSTSPYHPLRQDPNAQDYFQASEDENMAVNILSMSSNHTLRQDPNVFPTEYDPLEIHRFTWNSSLPRPELASDHFLNRGPTPAFQQRMNAVFDRIMKIPQTLSFSPALQAALDHLTQKPSTPSHPLLGPRSVRMAYIQERLDRLNTLNSSELEVAIGNAPADFEAAMLTIVEDAAKEATSLYSDLQIQDRATAGEPKTTQTPRPSSHRSGLTLMSPAERTEQYSLTPRTKKPSAQLVPHSRDARLSILPLQAGMAQKKRKPLPITPPSKVKRHAHVVNDQTRSILPPKIGIPSTKKTPSPSPRPSQQNPTPVSGTGSSTFDSQCVLVTKEGIPIGDPFSEKSSMSPLASTSMLGGASDPAVFPPHDSSPRIKQASTLSTDSLTLQSDSSSEASEELSEERITCYRHPTKLIPASEIDIDPKTKKPFRTCNACREKAKESSARRRKRQLKSGEEVE